MCACVSEINRRKGQRERQHKDPPIIIRPAMNCLRGWESKPSFKESA